MTDSNTSTGYIKVAKRLSDIPPYLFQRIDDMKSEARATGLDLISLGIGDPDLPTPPELVDELYEQSKLNANQKYPNFKGIPEFRKAVADFYNRRFGVELDPVDEVLALIGSKEGIANLALSVLDPEDIVIVPDPSYPVYAMLSVFAGCRKFVVPLKEENGFLIDWSAIPDDIARQTKLVWMNYPNNPTSAVAPIEFFDEAVQWAKKWGVILAHDNPYSEIYQQDDPPPSLLSAKGAKEVGVEFNSLSKSFNMTGWRIGMVVGNRDVVQALARVKSNIDSGVFVPIQKVAVKALNMPAAHGEELRKIYAGRRKACENALEEAGYEVYHGKGTFYLWAKTPKGMKSFDFVSKLIMKTGIVVGPGSGWGEQGEGYFRICLTRDEQSLADAVKVIAENFPAK